VVAVNEELQEHPELINSGPYEAGWMLDLRLADGGSAGSEALLDAAAYGELTGG
jgi:glycine cleavage system H protein